MERIFTYLLFFLSDQECYKHTYIQHSSEFTHSPNTTDLSKINSFSSSTLIAARKSFQANDTYSTLEKYSIRQVFHIYKNKTNMFYCKRIKMYLNKRFLDLTYGLLVILLQTFWFLELHKFLTYILLFWWVKTYMVEIFWFVANLTYSFVVLELNLRWILQYIFVR